MKKAFRPIIAILLVVMMFAVFVAACSDDDDPDIDGSTPAGPGSDRMGNELARLLGLPETPMADQEDIEFTIFSRNMGIPGSQDNPILQLIKEITGVTIKIDFLVGDINNVFGTMLSGGIQEDAMFVGALASEAIAAQAIMPICDLIEAHAPNLRAHYDPWWEQMKAADGNVYTAEIWGTYVGQSQVEFFNGTGFWLQKSVIDFHGRAPNDFDELFEFVYEYMEANPTIDGMTTLGVEFGVNAQSWLLTNSPIFLAGNPNWGSVWNRGGGRVGATLDLAAFQTREWTNTNARPYYKKLNEMYNRTTSHGQSVIDSETFSRGAGEFEAVISQGRALLVPGQQWVWEAATNTLIAANLIERTHVPLDFVWPGNEYNYWDLSGGSFSGNNGLNISFNNADPIRFAQFLDWIIQEDVQRFLSWGIERDVYNANAELLQSFGMTDGYHYYYEGGRIYRPQEMRDLQNDSRWTRNNMGRQLRDMLPKIQGTFTSDGNPVDPGTSPEEFFASLTEFDKGFYTRHNIEHFTGFMKSEPLPRPDFYPLWGNDPPPGSDAAEFGERTGWRTGFDGDLIVPLIRCAPEEFDALWEEYLQAIDAIPSNLLEAHLAFYTDIAQRAIAAAGG
jgi:putative aldouronate transport system substrate-binding protein